MLIRTEKSSAGCFIVLARHENLLAETRQFAARPALADRALSRAPAAKPPANEPATEEANETPTALPLPPTPEPLVMEPASDREAVPEKEPKHDEPLPRNRALVAPTTGLVGRLVAWFSGSTRRLWQGAPSVTRPRKDSSPDPLSVMLLRAELRELRAELAIARRVAERREVLARSQARQG